MLRQGGECCAGQITADGLRDGVTRVLAEPSFAEAARNVSTRMRAHRLKPAEKAAGAVRRLSRSHALGTAHITALLTHADIWWDFLLSLVLQPCPKPT